MRHLIIGDIHGCYEELVALLEKAGLNSDDKIIALGDILDRGPNPVKVMEFFSCNPQASSIRGNHEHKHILINQGIVQPSISQKITCNQFSLKAYENLINNILQFPLSIETDSAILLHGAFEPYVNLSDQKPAILLGTRACFLILQPVYNPILKIVNLV